MALVDAAECSKLFITYESLSVGKKDIEWRNQFAKGLRAEPRSGARLPAHPLLPAPAALQIAHHQCFADCRTNEQTKEWNYT